MLVAVFGLVSLSFVFPYRNDFSAFAYNQSQFFKYKMEFSSNGSNLFANAISAFVKSNPDNSQSNSTLALSVPVLLYHGIVPESDRFSITEEVFKDQMFALKKAGYSTITLNEFYGFIHEGKSLPDKSFLLTFDDGRLDSYRNPPLS